MAVTRKHILVLEVHAKAALPVLESCKAMGLHVIAGSWKKHCCGIYSRAVSDKIIYPRPDVKPDQCIRFLLDYLQDNNVQMIFPVGDIMTDLIAKHQDRFREATNVLLPPYDIFTKGRNKVQTLKTAKEAGCPIPLTWYPDYIGLDQAMNEIECYPVLIKPAVSAGARGITVCNDPADIRQHYPVVKEIYGECFIQDFVPQQGIQYKVDAVMDVDHNLLAGVVYEKLRYYPPEGGSSVLNKSVHRPDILDAAVRVMTQLKWVGLCDFDFIQDPRDGIIKLMEINPRFPESFRATVAAGVDMTKILYQLAMGQTPEKQLEYKAGQYNRFLLGDVMWFLKTKENRLKAKPSFFRFWGKDMYYQLIRKNDFGPIGGYILENMEMLWNKKLRQERLR
jgi:predicted ATP-grasp superfamily ATP-dependent carboligase